MNTTEMMRLLDTIARERKVEKAQLIRVLERAMVSACRKHYGTLDSEEFRCELDPMTGAMKLYRHNEPLELSPQELGRIAGQTFKQVMIQGFRDDERTSLIQEFSKRVGDIVTGAVQRYDGGALVVTIDRAEAFMPRSEQIPGEMFQPGDRIRCLVLDVRDAGNAVKIVLSRGHPDFIKRLFEVEVPEVSEKIIEVKAMAREAGYRTKIAVASVDSKVDPVGACVGVRGSRIKTVTEELNGERIDIVRWNDSLQVLIPNALQPASIEEVFTYPRLGKAIVLVNEDQLSLAIGRRGQNVRLASKLVGWDLEIMTHEELDKELGKAERRFRTITQLDEDMLNALIEEGFMSFTDLTFMEPAQITEMTGLSEDEAEEVIAYAEEMSEHIEKYGEPEEPEPEPEAEVGAAAEEIVADGEPEVGESGEADALADEAMVGEDEATVGETVSAEYTTSETEVAEPISEEEVVAGEEPAAEEPVAEAAEDATSEAPAPADEESPTAQEDEPPAAN